MAAILLAVGFAVVARLSVRGGSPQWDDLIDAIRNDEPYNETARGAESSLISTMGRMAAHTGQVITFEKALNCKHEFAPGLDELTEDSPAPLQLNSDGKYPCPQPGVLKDREY